MKVPYVTKEKVCIYLSNLGKKHIAEQDIVAAAKVFGLGKAEYPAIFRAWTNFVQTGGKTVDRRIKYTSAKTPSLRLKPSIKGYWKYNDSINRADAGKILLEYMNTKISSRALSEKYQVSVNQIYDWIRELEVSGTLLGDVVLQPKKYSKPTVVDVIWYRKHPETKRASIAKLSIGQKSMYNRVADVLEAYL